MAELVELRKKIEHELAVGKGEDIAIIKLVEDLMEYGYHSRASDVHVDPELDKVRIRFRIDGVLQDVFVFPKKIQQEIITRIKVLSGLRTDEHQAAQDGRFRAAVPDIGYVDVRVSIAPTYDGENAVMRILAEHSKILSLNDLGMNERDFKCVKEAIKKPYGMILATGPTGSGKTTTLYTIIKELNTDEISIITIEDPIEYSIGGIDQIQVNSRTGLTFAAGLRSILRQDPNVIMVGEIRDEETAGIAVNAALTGHLMLSTIHTNNAATTLPRLMDMKIEPFLIASTVNVAIGQRLVRKICQDCRVKKKMSDAEFKSLSESLPPKLLGNRREFYVGKGCLKCNNSGYYGRLGIYEVLNVDEEMRQAIMKRVNTDEINNIAVKSGMTTMLEDGFKKAIEGKTTIEEVLRVIHE
ncbi:type II/IV secretion system protein [Candidatus Wolfebacteria bacterium]|nr:type II/IV secretion system protein [Candidatus Wolfebacteria bacterium]